MPRDSRGKGSPTERLGNSSSVLQRRGGCFISEARPLAFLPSTTSAGHGELHHGSWDPNLPLHHRHTPGNTLFQCIQNSPHLCLLSPTGLATRADPYTGAASTLDLFIGDPGFSTITFSTGPYMGSDHLPILATPTNRYQIPTGVLASVENQDSRLAKNSANPTRQHSTNRPATGGSCTSPPTETGGSREGSLPPHQPSHSTPP